MTLPTTPAPSGRRAWGRWVAPLWLALEVVAFFLLARLTSWWAVLALTAIGFFAGPAIMRLAGARSIAGLSSAAQPGSAGETTGAGRAALVKLGDSALLFAAGALITVPGLITDVVGLALLVPSVRRLVAAAFLVRLIRTAERASGWTRRFPGGGPVVQGTVIRRDDPHEQATSRDTTKPEDPKDPPAIEA